MSAASSNSTGRAFTYKIELEAQAEQNIGGVLVAGDTRVAHGSEEDCIEILAEHLLAAFGESGAIAEVAICAPVEFSEFEGAAGGGCRGFEDADRLCDDFFSHTIAGD